MITKYNFPNIKNLEFPKECSPQLIILRWLTSNLIYSGVLTIRCRSLDDLIIIISLTIISYIINPIIDPAIIYLIIGAIVIVWLILAIIAITITAVINLLIIILLVRITIIDLDECTQQISFKSRSSITLLIIRLIVIKFLNIE